MDAIDTFEHAGLTVEIVPDDELSDIYNPREHDCNLGTMFCGHPDYNLGDEQLPRDGFDQIDCPACDACELPIYGPTHVYESFGRTVEAEPICPRCEGRGSVEPTVYEWLADQDAIAAMPLFLLDHSGLSIRTGKFIWLDEDTLTPADTQSKGRFVGDDAGWDTSFIGFIITTRERADELGVEITRENIERQLEGEVKEYDLYLTGDAGGYVIQNGDETLDSCWGFLGLWGDDAYVRTAAKEAAEACREAITKEDAERAHWAARDVMTA